MSYKDFAEHSRNIAFYDVKDQLKNHVYTCSQAAFDAGYRSRDALYDRLAFENYVEVIRAKFIAALGGLPPFDLPLNPVTTGVIQEDGFHIENVIFNSRPGVYVTANLYVPDGISGRTGAVLFLSGHAQEARMYDEYQVVCRHLVKAGLVVLAPDPVGQGERLSYWEKELNASTVSWGTTEHDHAGMQSLLLGDSIARYFVHDAMRSIDYLQARSEVDGTRIGVTGNSGGGTQTSLVMICDKRIAAAAPATFIMNRESYLYSGQAQDCEQIWKGASAFGFDHEDILLMAAPKPVLVLAVTQDFFLIEGTRATVERCARFWELSGNPGGLELFEEDVEHLYTPRMATKAAEFFSHHLNGRMVTPDSAAIKPIQRSQLWCTKSGQVRGEIQGAMAVYEENQARLEMIVQEKARQADDMLKVAALAWLKAKVFTGRKPCPLYVRQFRSWFGGREEELLQCVSFWWTQDKVMGAAVTYRHMKYVNSKLQLTIALWRDGTGDIGRHLGWIREICETGRAVMVLDLSGMGILEPNAINGFDKYGEYGTLYKLADDLIWLDDSIVALRAWEMTRALDAVQESFSDLESNDIRLHAEGREVAIALVAAFTDRRITEVEEKDGLEGYAALVRARHYDRHDILCFLFPDILKHCDLPDIRRWIRTT